MWRRTSDGSVGWTVGVDGDMHTYIFVHNYMVRYIGTNTEKNIHTYVQRYLHIYIYIYIYT